MSNSSKKAFSIASCGYELYIFHQGSKGERREENIKNAGKETKEKNKSMFQIRCKLPVKAALMRAEHRAENV